MIFTAAKAFGSDDPESFGEWLMSPPLTDDKLDILVNHLTVNETYFWREPGAFEALEGRILPELVGSRGIGDKRLRIWSAGCSTGEEPYSVAIALLRTLPSPSDWNITIIATDINARMLRRAREGRYGQWSFRNAPPWLADRFFQNEKDGKLRIAPEVGEMITFSSLNLARDTYPSELNNTNAMDIVFCRNTLMYFSAERAKRVVQNLYSSLVEGGWLIVGASDISPALFRHFECVDFSGALCYRKVSEPRLDTPCARGTIFERSPKQTVTIETEQAAASSPEAIVASVRGLADRGELAGALTLCEQAISREKLNRELRYLEATILLGLNREDEARAALERTLYLDQAFIPAQFAMGNLAMRRGDSRAARRCFENVLALLDGLREEDVLPESEGLTVGHFRGITKATMSMEEWT
jgi:chemotaxis protein methyltransferase CheR